jgi:hypothetical protein
MGPVPPIRNVAPVLEELGLKLLATLHLSVPERSAIPPAGLPFSVLVSAVTARLEDEGWFPAPMPANDGWTGARLQQRKTGLWVYEQHECSVGGVGPLRTRKVYSVGRAIRLYLEANGGVPIDGVDVDWTA